MDPEISLDCFVAASSRVAKDHQPVRIMIRLENDGEPGGYGLGDGQMSGWLFMSGEEIEEPDSVQFCYLGDIVNHDPAIFDPTMLPYLVTPAPCRFDRDDSAPNEVDPE